MYVLNEYMEFGVDTPHIASYNFKLVFHLLFSTIYSRVWYGLPQVPRSSPLSLACELDPKAVNIRSQQHQMT